tara:strand:+ start:92 stop:679 length:588 start_codon:yes stop_codon:yes gene_type:complete
MKQALFFAVFLIPSLLFGQDLEFLQKAESPCRESLVSLFELSEKDSLSLDEAKLAFQHAEEYTIDDSEFHCGLFTDIESGFLKNIVINFSSDSLVSYYIEYLRMTQNSAGEARSSDFEEIFRVYPESVIQLAEQQRKEFRDDLIFHLAWGYLNNTYPDSENDPIEKFWGRHSKLKDDKLNESPFIKDVITEIENL